MPIPGMGVYSAEERKYVSEQSVHGCSDPFYEENSEVHREASAESVDEEDQIRCS